MRQSLRPSIFFALLLSVVMLGGCGRQQVIKFSGATQGTTYHITVPVPEANKAASHTQDAAELQQAVERRLAEIDSALSNYRDDSELSRFNRAPVGEWIDLGRDLYAVLKISAQISRESAGAFDVTVAPLVNLWGFGPQKKTDVIPGDAEIAAAQAAIGYRNLELDDAQPRVRKKRALVIDVNGIAQGYTVDQLADVLSASGYTDFMVEVGGELRLVGHNPDAKPWRIGIEKPGDDFVETQQALAVTGVGVTTAGDYHDYFEKDGVRYSHTIDPRSGRPIAHKLASVTVIASSATLADGYDTVLEVLGPDAGFEFAQRHELAAYFIVREGDGFTSRHTTQMAQYLDNLRP
ncbi:MAG: FAD:protein FMN transferase [Spongiibacteraceae bacterium]